MSLVGPISEVPTMSDLSPLLGGKSDVGPSGQLLTCLPKPTSGAPHLPARNLLF